MVSRTLRSRGPVHVERRRRGGGVHGVDNGGRTQAGAVKRRTVLGRRKTMSDRSVAQR
jgi:hypothetical protein